MKTGVKLIARERDRHRARWTSEHDDKLGKGELGALARLARLARYNQLKTTGGIKP